jgi:hypothetical protein
MKPLVLAIPSGDETQRWAVVLSTHDTKGAADKAANEASKDQERVFRISLTEKQVQCIIDALTRESHG